MPIARSTLRAAAAALAASALPAAAQTPPVPGLYYDAWYDARSREHDAPPQEFRLINYFFSRGSFTNAVGDPSGLRGVSLGPLGMPAGVGSAVETAAPGPAAYVEQRWIPVFEYQPNFLDGRAAFRAQVEIDYMWGYQANSVQPNVGGGFNADEVNVQTKNVNVAIYPWKDPDLLTILVGTQPLYDAPVDPTRTGLADIVRSGYKLAYVGSDATGIQLFSQRFGQSRLAWFPLVGAQPDKATKNDPRMAFAWLAMLDHAIEVAPGSWIGGSLWLLNDTTKGDGYAYEGLVRAGPASGGLSAFTGTQPFQIDRPNGTVVWAGANFHHNVDFRTGRLAANGFFMYDAGAFRSQAATTSLHREVTVRGFGADAAVLWNWGRTTGDVATAEAIVTNGDGDPTDARYTGPFTLNYYGLPGAVFFDHRMLLLLPFTSTIGNYSGAVTDLSNQGYGLVAGLATVSRDLVPNRLNLKVGVGHGRSWATPVPLPGSTTPRGRTIGTEVNAELKLQIRYLMTVGLHAAYLVKGDWFAGQTSRITENPWAGYLTFTWYAF